jgi:tetraacyldisaccharide 4'-kinase
MRPNPWFLPFVPFYRLGFLIHSLAIRTFGLRQPAVLPTLVVGNLTAGGSGKTPMVMYLAKTMSAHRSLAVLSRGYGRKKSGICEVLVQSDPQQVGDEALEIKRALPQIPVVVGENRRSAIAWIQKTMPQVQWILLDDGLQHHALKPDLSICLVSARALDAPQQHLLPAGPWRQPLSDRRQFTLSILTKHPANLACPEGWDACFSEEMGPLYDVRTGLEIPLTPPGLLLTGLAEAHSLCAFLPEWEHVELNDHAFLNQKDIEALSKRAAGRCIATTAKDLARLGNQLQLLPQLALLPLSIKPLFPSETNLTQILLNHVERIERSRGISAPRME